MKGGSLDGVLNPRAGFTHIAGSDERENLFLFSIRGQRMKTLRETNRCRFSINERVAIGHPPSFHCDRIVICKVLSSYGKALLDGCHLQASILMQRRQPSPAQPIITEQNNRAARDYGHHHDLSIGVIQYTQGGR
jgi:hypothetical protein